MEILVKTLFEMSLTASIVILMVVAVRWLFVLLGVPKRYACLLWVLPLIRLVCPWSMESDFSLLPDTNQMIETAVFGWQEMTAGTFAGFAAKNQPDNSILSDSNADNQADMGNSSGQKNTFVNADKDGTLPSANNDGKQKDMSDADQTKTGGGSAADLGGYGNVNPGEADDKSAAINMEGISDQESMVWGTLFGIWLAGVFGIAAHSLISYGRLKKRLAVSVLLKDNIYLVDEIGTAFVVGYRRPVIYLPSGIPEADIPYVITHEQTHIGRKDHWVKPLAFFITALHWFNPFCWLAFVLLGKDMEMSCDEAVIERLGPGNKKQYACVLLAMATEKMQFAGMPLAFAEGDPKSRIKNVLKYRKPAVLVSVVAVVVTVLLAVMLLTGPKSGDNERVLPTTENNISYLLKQIQVLEEQQKSKNTELEAVEPELQRRKDQLAQIEKSNYNEMMKNPVAGVTNPDDIPFGAVDITDPVVMMGMDGGWGADFMELVYASPEYAVGYGHMGLFVYSVKEKKITGAVNVKVLGCNDTQGDNYTDVFVADAGATVYLHPIQKDYMFAYHIFENTLEKMAFTDGGDGRPEGMEIDDIRQDMISVMGDKYADYWISSKCVISTVPEGSGEDKKYLCYLQSASGAFRELAYVVAEWNEEMQAWSQELEPGGGTWAPYKSESYPFFEGDSSKYLWEYTEDSQMYFAKAAGLSDNGLTLGVYNNSDQRVICGAVYKLYTYSNGNDTLLEVPYLDDIAYTDIAQAIEPQTAVTMSIDWSSVYGRLPADVHPVRYRLVKEIYVPKTELSGDEATDGAESLEDRSADLPYEKIEMGVDFTFPAEEN